MRIYLILAGIILVLSTGLYFSLSATFTAKSELRATKVSLDQAIAKNKGLEAFTESLQGQVLEANTKSGASRRGVEDALLKEKEWSNTAVPSDITTELCSRINCSTPESR